MSEVPISAAAGSKTGSLATSDHTGSPRQFPHHHRGGRGSGGESLRPRDRRGSGRGGGGGRGRGRGRGVGETGRKPHRPRAGKRPREAAASQNPIEDADSNDQNEEKRRKEGEGEGEESSQGQQRQERSVSAFTELYRKLEDAAQIAAYVREHISDKVFQDPKNINRLLQAMSNRPEALYEELMRDYKGEVAFFLERLLTLYSLSSKTPMTPQAHEFIIRCEQQGVQTAAWGANFQPVSGMEPSLLTPRELLKRLSAVDPVGHLQRRIELCNDIYGMVRCVKKMEALFSAQPEERSESSEITYAIKCQLNSKLISKARRLLTPPGGSLKQNKAGKSAVDEEHDQGVVAEDPIALDDPTTGADGKNAPGVIIPLTSEERDRFKDIVSRTLVMFKHTLHSTTSATGTQQPILKWGRFADWCSAHHLIHADDFAAIQDLEERRNVEMVDQLSQLETVMKLKTLQEGSEEELRALVEELWRNGGEKCLRPCSLDVLSCLATAATANHVSQEVKSLVADRLLKTQLFFSKPRDGEATERIQLPRRALRFVNEQRAKQQNEITTHQRIAAESHPSNGEDRE